MGIDKFAWKAGDVTVTPPDHDTIMVNRNLDGKVAEKNGNIGLAIQLYEANVAEGFDGSHPYNRLAVIYHKMKRYDDEARVLKRAIEIYSNPNKGDNVKLQKFKDRLAKLENKR